MVWLITGQELPDVSRELEIEMQPFVLAKYIVWLVKEVGEVSLGDMGGR